GYTVDEPTTVTDWRVPSPVPPQAASEAASKAATGSRRYLVMIIPWRFSGLLGPFCDNLTTVFGTSVRDGVSCGSEIDLRAQAQRIDLVIAVSSGRHGCAVDPQVPVVEEEPDAVGQHPDRRQPGQLLRASGDRSVVEVEPVVARAELDRADSALGDRVDRLDPIERAILVGRRVARRKQHADLEVTALEGRIVQTRTKGRHHVPLGHGMEWPPHIGHLDAEIPFAR